MINSNHLILVLFTVKLELNAFESILFLFSTVLQCLPIHNWLCMFRKKIGNTEFYYFWNSEKQALSLCPFVLPKNVAAVRNLYVQLATS